MGDEQIAEPSYLETGPVSLEPSLSIFVLPAHLSVNELHDVESALVESHASLTYDITEARLALGKVSQKKRAMLELRAKGLWTKDISDMKIPEPLPKRRRLDTTSGTVESARDAETIDLTQDHHVVEKLEDEKALKRGSDMSLKPPKSRPSSAPPPPEIPTLPPFEEDEIRVIKLDWVFESLKAGRSLPLGPFTIYRGQKIDKPVTASPRATPSSAVTSFTSQMATPRSPSTAKENIVRGAIERAKLDAASSSRSPYHSPTPYKAHHAQAGPSGRQSHKQRPDLHRKSTSEYESGSPLPPLPDWVRDKLVYSCLRSAPLHHPNKAFTNQLEKIKKVRELTLDEIGVRAYSTSMASIAAYPYPLKRVEEVLSLPGCDTRIGNLFAEWKQSEDGTLEAARLLEEDPVFNVLDTFHSIWGVGAKSARDFYYQRQWRSLDDIVEQGWNSLSRVQQIGVKYYDEFLEGISRSEIEGIARTICHHTKLARPDADYDGIGIECIIVGGYRRGKEVSGDVDIILTHRDDRVTHNLIYDVVACLEEHGWITHTLALHLTSSNREQQTLPYRGESGGKPRFDSLDKALVVWQDPHFEDLATPSRPSSKDAPASPDTEPRKRNPNPHRRVDIIISPFKTIGCAVLGWSGATTFERDIRRYAKKAHNWKFDSSGIRTRSGGRVVDLEGQGKTWQERERLVMEGLGIGWRPPEERCTG